MTVLPLLMLRLPAVVPMRRLMLDEAHTLALVLELRVREGLPAVVLALVLARRRRGGGGTVTGSGTWATPLTEMLVTSATPWTSISTSAELIVPVGVGTCWPPAASVAAVNVYVAEPSPLTTGVTLLQPRKNSSVGCAEVEARRAAVALRRALERERGRRERLPARPVMSAPAAAFVGVGQFFSRCSTPFEYVATGQPVLPGSKTPGTSAAAAVEARASVSAAVATMIAFFMWGTPCSVI